MDVHTMCDLSLSFSCNLHLHHLRFGLPILHPPPAGPISIYPAFSWTQRVRSPANVTLEDAVQLWVDIYLSLKKHLHFHSCWRTSTFSYYTTEFAVKYEPSFFGCRGTSGICCGVSEIRIASDKWESRSVLGQIVLFWNQDFEGFRH